MRIAIISSTDSALKLSLNFLHDWENCIFDLFIIEAPHAPNDAHVKRLGYSGSYTRENLKNLAQSSQLKKYDAVLLLLTGQEYRLFYEYFNLTVSKSRSDKRPIFFGGAVGIDYRQRPNILYYRCGLDLYWIHAPADLARQEEYKELFNFKEIEEVLSGLPFACPGPSKRENMILFAGQPDVPQSKQERLYVVHKLLDLAKSKPTHEVILKPRVKPGEQTFHTVAYYYEDLVNEIAIDRPIPQNFKVCYDPIIQLLSRTELMLTISSTAAVEARMMGVNLGIINDFPPKPDYGRNFFSKSGCLINFDDLIAGQVPVISQEWEHHNLYYNPASTRIIYEKLKSMLNTPPHGSINYIPGDLKDYTKRPKAPNKSPYQNWRKKQNKLASLLGHENKIQQLQSKWKQPTYRLYRYSGISSIHKILRNISLHLKDKSTPILNIKNSYGKPKELL